MVTALAWEKGKLQKLEGVCGLLDLSELTSRVTSYFCTQNLTFQEIMSKKS